MNFSEVFIKRPIATSLLMAAIALFGVVAYQTLPVSDMPNVEMPTIQVQANLPGADPATMASSVATVLERQFSTISGVDSMRSSSSTGSTQITLQFDVSREVDGASVDVQTAIAEAIPLLPSGMPSPPSFKKQNPGDQPVFYLTLTSDTIPISTLADRLYVLRGLTTARVTSTLSRTSLAPDVPPLIDGISSTRSPPSLCSSW